MNVFVTTAPPLEGVSDFPSLLIGFLYVFICIYYVFLYFADEKEEPEKLMQCPYDKNHQIRPCRFPYHIIKCRKVERTSSTWFQSECFT